MDLNTLSEPENLTEPTEDEYQEAIQRMWSAAGEQGIRDMHTAMWYGWNRGYNTGKGNRS